MATPLPRASALSHRTVLQPPPGDPRDPCSQRIGRGRAALCRTGAEIGAGGPGARRASGRLLAYFEGEQIDFGDVELELDWCTPFQRSLVESLRAVPRGHLVTYGELAALAG